MLFSRLEMTIFCPTVNHHLRQAQVSVTWPLQLRNEIMQRDVQLSAGLGANRTELKT